MKTSSLAAVEGVYYVIIAYSSGYISSDIREDFVFVSKDGVYDSREVDYWSNISDLNDENISSIEQYEAFYECIAEPTSLKRILLYGVERCYADRE